MKGRNWNHMLWVGLLVLTQCKHPAANEAFLGPEITPENFSVQGGLFKAGYASVDFGKEDQYFLATFSNNVKWYISIVGLESKAVKRMAGIGQTLDLGNASWDGSADSVYFFKTQEECVATLTFFNSALTLKDTFRISQEKVFEGILLDDFEENSLAAKVGIDSQYTDAGDKEIRISFRDSSVKVQGNSSLLLSGIDANGNYWIGGVNTASQALAKKVGKTDASALYLNLSVYGTIENQAGLAIKLYEDDDSSGSYSASKDDAYTYSLKVDWVGWKKIAIAYRSFADDSTGTGDNDPEPSHLVGMNMALIAYTSTATTQLNTDYIILTTGKPLNGSTLK